MDSPIKSWFKKVFSRDINLTQRGFLYFLVALIFYLNSIMFIIISFVNFDPIQINPELGLTFLISTILMFIFGGLIVDKFKNRMKLALISGIFQIIGLILFFFYGTFLSIVGIIGFAIMVFSSGIILIDWSTIITHETTILNRGRILGYLFFIASIISLSTIILIELLSSILIYGNIIALIIIQLVLFFIMIDIEKKYSYIETKERLASDLKFKNIISKKAIKGYLIAFLVLGIILGNAFPVGVDVYIEPLILIVIGLFFLILSGVLLDNQGRKWSFVGGIFILSSVIIFSNIFSDYYLSIFFGVSISIIIISLLTFIGDFSTKRNTLKYRGRISGIFLLLVFIGILCGITIRVFLTQIYYSDTKGLSWVPNLINGINSFLLVGILVWIMPLPEILSAKESDWQKSLRNMYVFNRDSTCLYAKNFISKDESLKLPSEDLITGGLAGILTLISEITNEKKNLRIIDKDKIKIYFSYGKSIIVALTSTNYLPILFKKLLIFTKAFERKFDFDLTHFAGKINVFLDGTEPLLTRYFS